VARLCRDSRGRLRRSDYPTSVVAQAYDRATPPRGSGASSVHRDSAGSGRMRGRSRLDDASLRPSRRSEAAARRVHDERELSLPLSSGGGTAAHDTPEGNRSARTHTLRPGEPATTLGTRAAEEGPARLVGSEMVCAELESLEDGSSERASGSAGEDPGEARSAPRQGGSRPQGSGLIDPLSKAAAASRSRRATLSGG
jgi:hypothetical protein